MGLTHKKIFFLPAYTHEFVLQLVLMLMYLLCK